MFHFEAALVRGKICCLHHFVRLILSVPVSITTFTHLEFLTAINQQLERAAMLEAGSSCHLEWSLKALIKRITCAKLANFPLCTVCHGTFIDCYLWESNSLMIFLDYSWL